MKKILILSISLISFLFSSYSEGQQISITDQQLSREVCFASEFDSNYNLGDDFSLYDLNGDTNGGNYHVSFIDMSATW